MKNKKKLEKKKLIKENKNIKGNDLIVFENVSKVYKNNFIALDNINLKIKQGEIFALLGPNGAGKSTLINVLCGLVFHSSGKITIGGLDITKNRKEIKKRIGIVPQELHLEAFEKVKDNIAYSRGLWGKKEDKNYLNTLLEKLKLSEKKNSLLLQLSGGMKRRVLIAKALSHEPDILFLDEPSAGVDVELRKEMWEIIYNLKKMGITIILTTHYIEEAEEIADRVGFINGGKIVLVDKKESILNKLGHKKIVFRTKNKISEVIKLLHSKKYNIKKNGKKIEVHIKNDKKDIKNILDLLQNNKITFGDLDIQKRSLESIFVNYINGVSND